MSEVNKGKISNAVGLLKKGATLLSEVCPKCGNLQVRYKNRTLCLVCNDLSNLEAIESISCVDDIPKNLRDLILNKISKLLDNLNKEDDINAQAKIADLLLLYFEILERIKNPRW